MSPIIRRLIVTLAKFGSCGRGNVAIISAFAALPMLLGLGITVDYGLAMKRQAKMNAAADAAALDAVTPTMMKQPALVAQIAAAAFFQSQVSSILGVVFVPTNLSVTVTDTPSSGTVTRTASVNYQAASTNSFAALLNTPTLTIRGTSSASASSSPNIDFYLMLDTSPSMAIAATQPGINSLMANTPQQDGGAGCAFACHETNPVIGSYNDAPGNPGNEDNYALARSLGVTLRIDLVQQAVAQLMSTAKQTESNTGAIYRMAGYDFDVAVNNVIPLTSNLTTAQNEASNIQMLTVYHENMLTSSNNNSDEDTNFGNAFTTLNNAMPTPGGGTNGAGDSPQEVLFLVSDGVSDVSYNGRKYGPFGVGTYSGQDWCSAIKARNIRIAVLYTTYLPLPTNGWYNSQVAPIQPSIAPAAQACASPNLYFQVAEGGDISAAMGTLFSTIIQSAHLTN